MESSSLGLAFQVGGARSSTSVSGGAGLGCVQCRDLQRQLMDLSAQNARSQTRGKDARKAADATQASLALVMRSMATLRSEQAELESKTRKTQELTEAVRSKRGEAESNWRQEARARQQTYDEAKAESSRERISHAEAQEAVVNAEAEVQRLRRALDEALLDIEDARAALLSTETRVAADADNASKVMEDARRAAAEACAEADASHEVATVATDRLQAVGENVEQLKTDAEFEENRGAEVEREVADIGRRVEAGRAATTRLRTLREEATSRLQDLSFSGEPHVDRGCSPHRGNDDAVAALRRKIEDFERQLSDTEIEKQQLRQLCRQDVQRQGARLERLRMKVESLYSAREEFRRSYKKRTLPDSSSLMAAAELFASCENDLDFDESDDEIIASVPRYVDEAVEGGRDSRRKSRGCTGVSGSRRV